MREDEHLDTCHDAGDAGGEVAEGYALIKKERMPDGRMKLILKHKESGEIIQKIEEEG